VHQDVQTTASSTYKTIKMVKSAIEKLLKKDFLELNESGLYLYVE
jgi:hypothetical protein